MFVEHFCTFRGPPTAHGDRWFDHFLYLSGTDEDQPCLFVTNSNPQNLAILVLCKGQFP